MSKKVKKEDPLDYLSLPAIDIDPEIKKGIFALILTLVAIVSALGLFNASGAFGSYLNDGLTWSFGWGRWLAPILFLAWAVFIFFKEKLEIRLINYTGLFLNFLAIEIFLQLIVDQADWDAALLSGGGGGHLGWILALGLIKAIGMIAAFVAIIILLLIGFMFMFNTTLAHLFHKGSAPARFLLNLGGKNKDKKSDNNEDREDCDNNEEENEDSAEDDCEEENEEDEAENEDDNEDEENSEDETDEEENKFEPSAPLKSLVRNKNNDNSNLNIWKPTNIDIDLPIELLSKKIGKPNSGDVKANKEIIKNTFENFGIEVEMGEVAVGPTVAQYTLKPAEGVKLSKITTLNSDLAMALAAHPIRIEAPIPGKSLVGIEVPNKAIATVGLREILGSKEFSERKKNTMISLGKDVAGKVWLTDLTRMPHLLVAGQTGSGKSVMLNTLIVSLLYQNNPDDLRLIMVDPKRVELTMYDGIPHLLTPVITEVSKTVNALKWSLNELDRRLRLLQSAKKKDILSYNATAKQKLPYIVFIIDELADLMIVAGKEVETGIVRLAQLARAVGIHLVLATQRPSVNVITGTIKANMPARIAFAVASGIDSRTILDAPGAEKLLGKGDMLFSDPSMSKPKRIQGAYVSELEIKRIVNHIKSNSDEIEYMEEITERQKVIGMAGVGIDGGSDDDDDVVSQAIETVLSAGRASTTFLQRKLSIGYPRAAKLMDQLEEMGIIGPGQGAKPREILITRDQWERMQSGSVAQAAIHNQAAFEAPQTYLDNENEEESETDDEDNEEEDEEFEEENEEGDDNEDEEDDNNDEEEAEEDVKKTKKTLDDFDHYFSR